MRLQIVTMPDKAFRQLAKRYSNAPKQIDKDFEAVVKETLKAIHINIRGEAPHRTGKLVSAIKWSMLRKLTGRVFIDQRMKAARYEPYVRTGAPPHIIKPKRAKALWWPERPGSATGKGSFALTRPLPMVRHPGQKPNPYFIRGVGKSRGVIKKAMQSGVKVVFKHLMNPVRGGG